MGKVFVLTVLAAFLCARVAGAADVDPALLADCIAKWQSLDRAASQLEVEYTFSIQEATVREPTVFKRSFLVGGEWVLYRTDDSAIRLRPNDLVYRVVGINSAYSFRVGRKRDSAEYVVTQLGPPDAEMRPQLAAEFAAGPGALWSFQKPLTALIADPDFKVEFVRREVREGRPSVVLAARYAPSQPSARLMAVNRVELVLDTTSSWSIRSYSVDLPEEYKITGAIDSTPNANGLPVPTTHKIQHRSRQVPVRTLETVFTKWNYRTSIADEEFRLSAIGLPEPVDAPPLQFRSPRYLWFLAAAVGFAILAVAFRWLTRRRNSPPAPEGTA